MTRGEATVFYEDDEDPAAVFARYDAGPHVLTARPGYSAAAQVRAGLDYIDANYGQGRQGLVNRTMRQEAPYPVVLEDLIRRLSYRDGYEFELSDVDRGQGSAGLTLVITVTAPDSYHPGRVRQVAHYMPVPPAAFDERSWRMWLFEQVGLVELHERMEFFKVDGKPAYPPAHGPGNSPYLLLEYGSDSDRRMSFRGELNPA